MNQQTRVELKKLAGATVIVLERHASIATLAEAFAELNIDCATPVSPEHSPTESCSQEFERMSLTPSSSGQSMQQRERPCNIEEDVPIPLIRTRSPTDRFLQRKRAAQGATTPVGSLQLGRKIARVTPTLLSLLFLFFMASVVGLATAASASTQQPANLTTLVLPSRGRIYRVKASPKAKQLVKEQKMAKALVALPTRTTAKTTTTKMVRPSSQFLMPATTTTRVPPRPAKKPAMTMRTMAISATTPKNIQATTKRQVSNTAKATAEKLNKGAKESSDGPEPTAWDSWEEGEEWAESSEESELKRRSTDSSEDEATRQADSKGPLMCATEGELWQRNHASSPFCRPPPDVMSVWIDLELDVFRRVMQPVKIDRAAVCTIKTELVKYYTNLFGDRFANYSIALQNVSAETCTDMQRRQVCAQHGTLSRKGAGLYSTNNVLIVDFPGRFRSLWEGARTSAATNCLLTDTELFYRVHDLQLVSPLYDLRHCQLHIGNCRLSDGSRLIWKAACGKTCQPCDYGLVARWKGETAEGVWVSKNREIALTFPKTAKSMKGCMPGESPLRASDQGYAILEADYQRIMGHAQRRKRQAQGLVLSTQLAAQLTASNLAITRAVQQLFFKECRRAEHLVAPTSLARHLLNRTDLQAKWVGKNMMMVYPCARIPFSQIQLRTVADKCFKYLPVKVKLASLDQEYEGFLDPVNNILSPTSQEADCLGHAKHVTSLHNELIMFNSQTGQQTILGANDVHQFPEQPATGGLSITGLTFHQLILFNLTSEFPGQHLEELERINDWKRREQIRQSTAAEALGALPHGLPGVIKEVVLGYLRWIHWSWINLCCAYVTIGMLRMLFPLIIASVAAPMSIPVALFAMFQRQRNQQEREARNRAVRFREPGTPLMTLRRLATQYDSE